MKTLISCLFAILLGFFSIQAYAQSVVTSTTSLAPFGNQSQRKSFYDSVNHRYWICLRDDTNIRCLSSLDGNAWTEGSSVAYATSDFDVTYKAISGVGYVFLAVTSGYNVDVMRGTIDANGTITFEAAIPLCVGIGSSGACSNPTTTISSDNRFWMATSYWNGTSYSLIVFHSQNEVTTDYSTMDGTVSGIVNATSYKPKMALAPLADATIILAFASPSASIKAYVCDSTSWAQASINNIDIPNWQAISSTNTATVYSMTFYKGFLYIGGTFNSIGENSVSFLARWDGSAWQAVGPLDTRINGIVNTLLVGPGDLLYVGGSFSTPYSAIATWDGTNWGQLGTGIHGGDVNIITSDAYGTLYAGGTFSDAGSVPNTAKIARWYGDAWHPILSELVPLAAFSGSVWSIYPGAMDTYVAGTFSSFDSDTTKRGILKLNFSGAQSLGRGVAGYGYSIAYYNGKICLGGGFSTAINSDGTSVSNTQNIACWNGTSWEALGSGLNGAVWSLLSIGDRLYAAGVFTNLETSDGTTSFIAVWDGLAWSKVGSGLNGGIFGLFNQNNDLYAGGVFSMAGLQPARAIAKINIENSLSDFSDLSLTSDNNGNAFALYTNLNQNLYYRQYSLSSNLWLLPQLLEEDKKIWAPRISYRSDINSLIASYMRIEDSAFKIYMSRVSSPWNSSSWAESPSLVSTSPMGLGYVMPANGPVFSAWVSSASVSPYTVSATTMTNANIITGTVNHWGSASAGSTVTLSGAASNATTTDASGNFSFKYLASGAYHLGASGGSLTSTVGADITVSTSDVNVTLDEATPTPTPVPTAELTPTATPGGQADVSAPKVYPRASSGNAGKTVTLNYRVSDNSGVTKETITIKKGNHTKKTIRTSFKSIPSSGKKKVTTKTKGWKKGSYSFCLVAQDRALNKSSRRCAKLTLR